MTRSAPEFPFSAVIGQDQFKLALILVAINPSIGGVLVSGQRGTAKSTLARGLPQIAPANQNFVTLPLGASEEMLVGTLDLQKVLDDQSVRFNPGLLAKAHQGVLYVDEVNLLPDNLVDLLLDVAASGVNHVERDGISHQHDSRFILLGTMNPDEGEIRPQLLDRFGLSVAINHQYRVEDRVAIVQQREDFDDNSENFIARYEENQKEILMRITRAAEKIGQLQCAPEMRFDIAQRCMTANVDGMRADIIWHKAAVAHAAWKGKDVVTIDDVDQVEELVLGHRKRESNSGSGTPPLPPGRDQSSRVSDDLTSPAVTSGDWGSMNPLKQETAKRISVVATGLSKRTTVRSKASSVLSGFVSNQQKGLFQGASKSLLKGRSVNWFQTLSANLCQWPLRTLKFKKHNSGLPVLHLVLLDTSASTLKNNRFAQAKAAILDIAAKAYLKRESLMVIGFGNQRVETLLNKQRSPKVISVWLDSLEAGGGTPFGDVLTQAESIHQIQLRGNPNVKIQNYIISDGKTAIDLSQIHPIGETLFVDIEESKVKRGRGIEIAGALNAHYYPLPV